MYLKLMRRLTAGSALLGAAAAGAGCDEVIEVRNSPPAVALADYCFEVLEGRRRVFLVLDIADLERDPVDVELVRCDEGEAPPCRGAVLALGPGGHGNHGLAAGRTQSPVRHPVEWAHVDDCAVEGCDDRCPDAPLSRVSACAALPASPPEELTVTVYASDDPLRERRQQIVSGTFSALRPCDQ